MTKRIILIDHHDNLDDDRVTSHLTEMGYEIDLRCPFKGDTLPHIDDDIAGSVIYGGAQSVNDTIKFPFLEIEVKWINQMIDSNLPLLGICLGAQLIAYTLGAKVSRHKDKLYEFGYYEVFPTDDAKRWMPNNMYVTQAHFEQFELPKGATLLATGNDFHCQAFKFNENIYAVQFHPEVTEKIFERWQNSDWAFFDQPGSQTREQQNALMKPADEIQGKWFINFLNELFPTTAILAKAS